MTDDGAHSNANLRLAFKALGFVDTDDVCWIPDCGCTGEAHE
jgi:hypothetical protein